MLIFVHIFICKGIVSVISNKTNLNKIPNLLEENSVYRDHKHQHCTADGGLPKLLNIPSSLSKVID